MSRYAETLAPVLKLLLVVAIVAAWVEANANWIHLEHLSPPAGAFSKAPPAPGYDPFHRTDTGASSAGNCSPMPDRRNATRITPARPAVIQT
ncbi:MAG TPA: hypothetical protein VFX67_03935 [Burkholderiales bacterium]|nr:hypothetical protein [Burkholderiales bacterium]